jgi:uncharacterized membrane protein (DUF485 family)
MSIEYDDPWHDTPVSQDDALATGCDAPASGRGDAGGGTTAPATAVPTPRAAVRGPARGAVTAADVYLEVQRSAAFREVRSRYRRFVVPAVAGFLLWYLAYVVAATSAPRLMARPVAGAVNVAMLAGLGQFLTTFLLTWAYARHARLRRDRAALELCWDTQELTRTAGSGTS